MLVRVCSNRCAPRRVHCICCFLTNRLLTTWLIVDSTKAKAVLRGCLKSRLRVTDHRGVMPITINTDKLYDTDLTDAAWALMLPAARRGGRPRTTNIRAVLNA